MTKRGLARLAITLVLASVVAYGMLGHTATDADRLADLTTRVACPVCETSVADSQAAYARNIRAYIELQIDEGRSDREILQGLRDSFGDEILLDPPASGFGLWLWLAPVAAIVGGGWATRSLRRTTRSRP